MHRLMLVSVLGVATACASTRSTYIDRGDSGRAVDVAACTETACGGSGDALGISLGVALLVGVAVAKWWRD